MLNIWINSIDNNGLKYLANALNSNEVRYDLPIVSAIDASMSLISDSHNIACQLWF